MKEFLTDDSNPTQSTTSGHSDDESMVGRRVGPYRIDREVGHGGMGTVYEAWRADGEFQHRVDYDETLKCLTEAIAERDPWLVWQGLSQKSIRCARIRDSRSCFARPGILWL
jgi:serine/threonine protein kinase